MTASLASTVRNEVLYSTFSFLLPPAFKQGTMAVSTTIAVSKFVLSALTQNPIGMAESALVGVISIIGFLEVGESDKAQSELHGVSKLTKAITSDEDEQLEKIEKLTAQEVQETKDLEVLNQRIQELEREEARLKTALQDSGQLLSSLEGTRQSLDATIERLKEDKGVLEKELENLKTSQLLVDTRINEFQNLETEEKRLIEKLAQQMKALREENAKLKAQLPNLGTHSIHPI